MVAGPMYQNIQLTQQNKRLCCKIIEENYFIKEKEKKKVEIFTNKCSSPFVLQQVASLQNNYKI